MFQKLFLRKQLPEINSEPFEKGIVLWFWNQNNFLESNNFCWNQPPGRLKKRLIVFPNNLYTAVRRRLPPLRPTLGANDDDDDDDDGNTITTNGRSQ